MHVYNSTKEELQLDIVLQIQDILIGKDYVLVEQMTVQYAGRGWKGDHALRYHISVRRDRIVLKDGKEISYSTSIGVLRDKAE